MKRSLSPYSTMQKRSVTTLDYLLFTQTDAIRYDTITIHLSIRSSNYWYQVLELLKHPN